jgi:hypothetical protein
MKGRYHGSMPQVRARDARFPAHVPRYSEAETTLRSDCLLRLHGRTEGTFGRLSHVKDLEGLGMLRMKDKPSFCAKVQLMSGTSP